MLNRFLFASFGFLFAVFYFSAARADQPIFNEMPRWDEGWGVQLVEEYRHESDLMSGNDVVAAGFSEDVHILHLEGVYTWDRSIRMTVKLPYVLDAKRELPDGKGGKITQYDEGIGDATVALPLKKYFNLDGRSGSWTFAPQVKIPLSGSDEYEVYDGAWGLGAGVGYETETYRYIFAVGASVWKFDKNEPFKASGSLDVGLNYIVSDMNGHVKWETDFTFEDDGTEKLYTGPSLYLRINDTLHSRIVYKNEIHARRNNLDHGKGSNFRVGLALVF